MEVKVEVVFTQREPVRRAVEPSLQVVRERRQRRTGGGGRHGDSLGLMRGADLPDQRRAPLVDAQRGLHEHADRFHQGGARVVQEPRQVLQSARERGGFLLRRPVAAAQQEVQPAEQVRQPERRILCLGALALEAAQHHADFVQERRTIDLVLELVGGRLLEGRGQGLERHEVGSEGDRAEAPVTVVVGLHPRLRRRHGVQMPSQIEVGALDLPERRYRHAACLSSRWHSSSERTRSVRFAASNNARHAASSSASYPCVSSQYFTFESPDTGEISIFCSSPNSWAGTELYTRSASQACPFFFALMIAAACTPVPVRNASSPITG